MRMTSRDKQLLFLLLSFIIVAAAWFGGARLIRKKTAELTVQKENLQKEYDERMRVLEKKEQYLQDTKDYNDAYTMMLGRYPSGISQDKQILYVAMLEDTFGVQIPAVSYTDVEPLYEFQSVEPGNALAYSLVGSSVEIPMLIDYADWKRFIDFVFSYPDKSTIPEVWSVYDALSGKVNVVLTMNQFAVRGEDRPYEVEDVLAPVGTDNLFTSSAALSYEGSTAEQIEAIKKNYDCYVMLHPTASDVKAKVIAGREDAEKVISEKNEEETLLITAAETDGKCSITYALGGGRPHAIQDLEGDTLDIYVLSSNRMGGTDLSGVRAYIDNQTTRTLRIAVTGEDAARPRFTVEEQSGSVEILR